MTAPEVKSCAIEVVAKQALSCCVMSNLVSLPVDRGLVSKDECFLASDSLDVATVVCVGQQPVKPPLELFVVSTASGEVPDKLGCANDCDSSTCNLSNNRNVRAEAEDCPRAKKDIAESQGLVNESKPILSKVVVHGRAQQIKAKSVYFGGRTPGGVFFTGIGGSGLDCDGGAGFVCIGEFAHLTSFISNMSPLKNGFTGGVAGGGSGGAVPAPNGSRNISAQQLATAGASTAKSMRSVNAANLSPAG